MEDPGSRKDVDASRARTRLLQRRANAPGASAHLVEAAVGELRDMVDELHVTGEELAISNADLSRALGRARAEADAYRGLFDLAPDGYLVTDGAGRVQEANPAAARLVGRDRERIQGGTMAALFGLAQRQRLRRFLMEPIGTGAVLAVDGADGGVRMLELRSLGASGADGGDTWWRLQDAELPILEGEDAKSSDPVASRRWLSVYSEMIEIAQGALEGLGDSARDDERAALENRLARLRPRRDAWRRRHHSLVGIELDRETRTLRSGERSVQLSNRELQLLGFLLDNPGVTVPALTLLHRAWRSQLLVPEQLRTYVVRLRQKLAGLEAPCTLENLRGRGYRLDFPELS